MHEQPQSIDDVLACFNAHKVMAVLRTDCADDAIWAASLLAEEGFGLLDVTYGTPETERVIATLREQYPDVVVGAGTVMTIETAKKAMDAGAQFLASPSFDPELVAFANENNILFLPGVTTPTEMAMAIKAGAKALKFFPAGCIGGAAYLKTVLAPLRNEQIKNVPVIATGGIQDDDIKGYIEAGALAVGTGSHLLQTKHIISRNEEKIRKRARKYLEKAGLGVCEEVNASDVEAKEKHDKKSDHQHKKHHSDEYIQDESVSDLLTPLT